jgi:hypothetical protein
MIWAGISLEAHTDLVFVENGAMTVHSVTGHRLRPGLVRTA